jgi:hypothetical protein
MPDSNATNPFAPFPFNSTLYEYPELCTIDTCPISWAASRYLPNLPGNAFYASVFGLSLAIQIFLGIRYRTWGFMAGMIGGCILEITGYVGRIQIHKNQFDGSGFLMSVSPLSLSLYIFSPKTFLLGLVI